MSTAIELLALIESRGARLELRAGRPVLSRHAVIVPAELDELRRHRAELRRELRARAAAARRRRVLELLDAAPASTRYAYLTDDSADEHYVIIALAIRDVGSCELWIDRDRYDGFELLELIHGHA